MSMTLSWITYTFTYLVICILWITIPLMIYYSQDPKDPTFTLQHASITAFNLTSDGHLTSFFNIILEVKNPSHKMKLEYSKVRVSIYKDKQVLAKDALDNFSQRKQNLTMLRSEPVALDLVLNTGPKFNLELESGMGYVYFDVFVTSYLSGYNLEVTCGHVVVNVTITNSLVASSPVDSSDNAKQKFQNIDCSVYVYRR